MEETGQHAKTDQIQMTCVAKSICHKRKRAGLVQATQGQPEGATTRTGQKPQVGLHAGG